MLDITFKYKKQLSQIINDDNLSFTALGKKHRKEYEILIEKQKEKIIAVLDEMQDDFSDFNEKDEYYLHENMEKFLINLLKQTPQYYWESYWHEKDE